MGKLAKWKGAASKVKSAIKGSAGSESIGKTGHKLLTLAGHAGLALASKNMTSIGPVPVRPDAAVLGLSVLGMMLAKGKTRKLAMTTAEASAHAIITRWVNQGGLTIINGPVAGTAESAAKVAAE